MSDNMVGREDVGRLALAAGMVDHQTAYGGAGWSALFRDQSTRVSSHDDELYPLLSGSVVSSRGFLTRRELLRATCFGWALKLLCYGPVALVSN